MWEGIDKRRFPRANFQCLITIRRKGSPISISTQTENIGAGGICVILKEGLDIFTQVDLALTLPDGLQPVKCTGTIVWVIKRAELKKDRPYLYDTGIEFSDLKDEDKQRIIKIVNETIQKDSPQ